MLNIANCAEDETAIRAPLLIRPVSWQLWQVAQTPSAFPLRSGPTLSGFDPDEVNGAGNLVHGNRWSRIPQIVDRKLARQVVAAGVDLDISDIDHLRHRYLDDRCCRFDNNVGPDQGVTRRLGVRYPVRADLDRLAVVAVITVQPARHQLGGDVVDQFISRRNDVENRRHYRNPQTLQPFAQRCGNKTIVVDDDGGIARRHNVRGVGGRQWTNVHENHLGEVDQAAKSVFGRARGKQAGVARRVAAGGDGEKSTGRKRSVVEYIIDLSLTCENRREAGRNATLPDRLKYWPLEVAVDNGNRSPMAQDLLGK